MSKKLGGAKDIYNDEMMLAYLCTFTMNMDVTPKVRDCILQLAKRFEWEGNQLVWKLHGGEKCVVLPPNGREELILRLLEDLDHYGVRKMHKLLQHHYWWKGMQVDIQRLIAKVCDWVRALLNVPMPKSQPLPIMGLGYKWSLDFVGTLPTTKCYNKYILVTSILPNGLN